jgi:cytochrome c biogenesis protein CcmG/thiol:disulfide interchange protein DsbE
MLLAAAVAGAVIIAGCGGGTQRSAAPSRAAVTAALAGSPVALAALHVQADHLLPGGAKAFSARLRRLRGLPVVVNEWASWCEPCQSEFPAYQRASLRYGRKVAFIGVDARDQAPAAASFLKRFPVTYPSYSDPSQAIAAKLQTTSAIPQTIYFARGGAPVYDHAGPYLTAAALESDIRRYALR